MADLNQAREKINAIDQQMVDLFEQRMQCVEDVIAYKKEHDLPILDASREQQVIEKNKQYLHHPKYEESYEQFMISMMRISRQYQSQIINQDRIGYQGIKGAFSYFATKRIFPNHPYQSYHSFKSLLEAVEKQEVCYGVIPFENSYSGEIGEVIDLLMDYDVYIQDIYDLKISQNLLGVKGATLRDIRQVYSKDQALEQSQLFLKGRDWELISYPNTAMAAEYIARTNDLTKAAIAAKENAEVYGLEILAEDINTSAQNTTRFIVVSKQKKEEGDRFVLAFLTHHKAGALANAMNIIAQAGFNMQSIKSRPIKTKPWEYYFYVEIDGSLQDPKVKDLLTHLQDVCKQVKVLGCYNSQKERRD